MKPHRPFTLQPGEVIVPCRYTSKRSYWRGYRIGRRIGLILSHIRQGAA